MDKGSEVEGYTYIASPYNDKDKDIRHKRYEAVCAVCVHLVKLGSVVYSPIAHWHSIATKFDLPKGFDFWQHLDLTMIERSNGIIVVKINGWDKSVGINGEIEYAHSIGKSVEYFDMERLHV